MHNHVDHRWIKAFLRKIIPILLVYSLFFTSTANAANVGGWALGGGVAQGASTVYEGTKQVIIDGKNYIKTGTAKITPAVSQVSKVLARGVAGVALSVAVEQLIGAVDWVLDPSNNQIVYYKESSLSCPTPQSCPQFLNLYWNGNYASLGYFGSPQAAAEAFTKAQLPSEFEVSAGAIISDEGQLVIVAVTTKSPSSPSSTGREYVYRVVNPAYDPNAEREKKTLPLDVVSAQVISNAESDTDKKAAAQVATTAAAADIVAEAETDETKARPITDQLNKSASTKSADSDAAANAGTGTATATPQADPVTGEQAPPTD
ncbi:hypothetical protein, partial [Acinetobacter sp. F_3_1]